MIAPYHGKANCSVAEVLAVNPFAPCGANRGSGFGGVTARLGRAMSAAMPFKANTHRLRSRRMKSF